MIELKPVAIGEKLVIQRHVTKEDTSLNYGSGKIENFFATPKLVAMMIEASSMLVDKALPEGFISIGKHAEVDHYKPTLLGGTVSVEVKVVDATEARVTLSMTAYDEVGKIGEGTHVRYLVNHQKLEEKAKEREKNLKA